MLGIDTHLVILTGSIGMKTGAAILHVEQRLRIIM